MISKFERFGFVPLEEEYNDLDLYRKGNVVLIALHKFRADRRASRESANHLDPPMIDELETALDLLKFDGSVGSLIIASAQLAAFCRGAKIELLLEATEEECRRFIDKAQQLILEIHRYPKPVIAMIDGFALGGGMELILGCDYRISSSRDTVVFGLPEASLGVIPAMGGTLNLRRLAEPEDAGDILLRGRADITAPSAGEMGLVDMVVPPEELLEKAYALASGGGLKRTSLIPETEPSVSPPEIRREIEEYLAGRDLQAVPGARVSPFSEALLRFLLEKTSPERFLEGLFYEREVFCFLQGTEDCREGITALVEERPPVFRGDRHGQD